ncbi:hypothetical protein [Dipodfec virus UA23Rod_1661]|uniref:Uncharacterized protein n=1 Tax=Dipodfec virus UA23Rod_1661 TaxID=2929254 RepID=A0A976R545_9VIRU|nr:hypothetical protein [Dipodfec virus UA23Rod_1661]
MNARRVNRSVKSINRKKRSRTTPAATIGNNCNPTTGFTLDERLFRNSILPLALANRWIETNTQIGLFEYNIPITENTDTIVFSEPNIFAVRILINANNNGVKKDLELNIKYNDNTIKNFIQTDIDTTVDIYYITITPINITVYEETPTNIVNTKDFNLKTASIIGINVTNGMIQDSEENKVFTIQSQTSVNTFQRKLYNFKH